MLVDEFSYLSMMAYRILFPLLLLLANVYVLLRGWQALPLPLGAVAYEYGNTWLIAFLYLLMAFVLLDIVPAARRK